MRVLLVAHHAYIDPASGAARCVRAMMEILAAAGHDCAAVTSGRFDSPGVHAIDDVHSRLGVHVRRDGRSGPRLVHRFRLAGVEVTAVATGHARRNDEDAIGTQQFARCVKAALAKRPHVVLAYGGHAVTLDALKEAKRAGARTIFTVRFMGYDNPAWYRHVDRVLFCSAYMARVHAESYGIHGAGIAPPILRADVEGDPAERRFVMFVNPSIHKGLVPFARLADMLGRSRPDIPLLVVQSRADGSVLTAIPEFDLAQYPQIEVKPAFDRPSQLWSLAKIAVMPTVDREAFGRIAAEAMINGVPAIVSDRGALPETVAEGGVVLPLPEWMVATELRIPTEAEMQPWFDAVVRLWDDADAYEQVAANGRAVAARLYDEADVRRSYVDYFEDPGPFEPVLDASRPASTPASVKAP